MAVTYITASELKSGTQNVRLSSVDDTKAESIIERAERYVDSVAGYWTKYDEDQTRKFPRIQDVNSSGVTFIHDIIKEATIVQSEFIFLQTPDDEHGIREDDAKKPSQVVSPRVKALLKGSGLTRRSGSIEFSESDYDPDRL